MARPTPEEAFRSRMAGSEKRATLRPLNSGEVVDTALKLYQKIALPGLKLTLIPALLCHAALTFVSSIIEPMFFLTRSPGNLGQEISELVVACLLGLLVAAPLFCLGLGRSMTIVASMASDLMLGRALSEERARDRAGRSTGIVIATVGLILVWSSLLFLVAGLFALIGMAVEMSSKGDSLSTGLAAVMAMLVLPIAFCALPFIVKANVLAPIVAAVEECGARQCMKRSQFLMRSHLGHGSGIGVLLTIVFILGIVTSALWNSLYAILEMTGVPNMVESWNWAPGMGQALKSAVHSLPDFAVIWLLLPIFTTALTVLYYDRIVRLEAYDVKVMIDDLSHAGRRTVLLR